MITSTSTIRLFEAEPDLIRFLVADERTSARATELPVRLLAPGPIDLRAFFTQSHAFGGLLLDGMLLQSLQIGDHLGLRLIGPGDVLSLSGMPRSLLVVGGTCRVTTPTRIVLLNDQLLLATRRWPRIVAGLHQRSGEQLDRLMTQLMICQLPRVEDRLLAMLWLLAEAWGQVTPSGTVLPLGLTHETLGGLIGARRSTVTLALRGMTDTGTVLRQDRGWLLLRRPPEPVAHCGVFDDPQLLGGSASAWQVDPSDEPERTEAARSALLDTVARLREEHLGRLDQAREQRDRIAGTRAMFIERREQLAARERFKRQQAPSA